MTTTIAPPSAPPATGVVAPPIVPRRARTEFTLDEAETPQQVKSMMLRYLDAQSAIYRRAATFNITFAHGSTILIIVLGLVTSISAAMDFAADGRSSWQLIAFPALSSILAALNLQFQFEKLARTRELCRIAVEELKCRAYLIPIDNMDAAMESAIELLESSYQLERDQVAEIMPKRFESGEGGQAV
jgi:hypothetical protein